MLDFTNKEFFIFDLDGTMVDLEQLNYSCFKDACSQLLKKGLTWDEYMTYFAGAGSVQGFQSYLQASGVTKTDEEQSQLVAVYRAKKQYYLTNSFDQVVTLKEGIIDFLIQARKTGRKLVVGTSTAKAFALLILEQAKLAPHFDAIITVDDVTKSKPAPDIFLKAMVSIGGTKEMSVIFEDTANGMKAAENAGIDVVIMTNPGKNDTVVAKAKNSIASYNEILSLLNR